MDVPYTDCTTSQTTIQTKVRKLGTTTVSIILQSILQGLSLQSTELIFAVYQVPFFTLQLAFLTCCTLAAKGRDFDGRPHFLGIVPYLTSMTKDQDDSPESSYGNDCQ